MNTLPLPPYVELGVQSLSGLLWTLLMIRIPCLNQNFLKIYFLLPLKSWKICSRIYKQKKENIKLPISIKPFLLCV